MSTAWTKHGAVTDGVWKFNRKAQLEILPNSDRMCCMYKLWPTPICPLCHSAWGTISHILSSCPVLSANAYTYRHNMVCDVMRNAAVNNGWQVASYGTELPPSIVKPALLTNLRNTRPDIVLYNDFSQHVANIVLVEVTVTFDNDRNIKAARRFKSSIYQPLLEAIKLSHPLESVSIAVALVVVGARGIIHEFWILNR